LESNKRDLSDSTLLAPKISLSERERQVLRGVARGEPNKAIARACSITEGTVKVHLKTILRKISAQNRTQAALWAVENRLLSEEDVPAFVARSAGSRRG
jgi:DNA-binding NarL/FixJ family response regulator